MRTFIAIINSMIYIRITLICVCYQGDRIFKNLTYKQQTFKSDFVFRWYKYVPQTFLVIFPPASLVCCELR